MATTTAPEERIARMEGQIEHMATRADIERVRADLSAEIQRVRADLSAEIERVRADLTADTERLRAEVARQSAMLTWRMIIVVGIAQAIGIGALLQFLPR